MSRTKPTLARIVGDYCELTGKIEELQEQQKALADMAYVNGLVKAGSEANARKVVKQLAKEMEMEPEGRVSQAQLEMALDAGRVELGIAVDVQTDLEDAVREMTRDSTTVEVRTTAAPIR